MNGNADPALRPPPPTVFRWTVLLLVSLAMFGNYYVYDTIAPVADMLKSDLGFSDSQIGQLYSVYSVAAIVVLLIGGVLIDRFGAALSTVLFGAICAVAGVVTAMSPEFPVMAAGRVLLGIGAEPLIVAVTTGLAKWFRGKELSFAFGVNLTIARLGSVAADNSPTWAGKAYASGWQAPLWIGAVIGLVCVVAGVLYWAFEKHAARRYSLGAAGEMDRLVWREIFAFSRSYWFIVALCITFYSAIFPFRSFAIKFFIEGHGMTREAAGALNSALPFAAMFATPLFGLLVDRVGKRALFMMVGSFLLMPVYLMLVYTDVPPIVPMALMGVAFSLIPAVMWPSVAYIVDPKRLGSAYALMTLIQQIGLAGMNQAIGWANDVSRASAENPGGYALGMWIFSVLGFLGFFFAWMLRREEKSPRGHGLETIKA
jgi:MFS family permease